MDAKDGLQRFHAAQDGVFAQVLAELRAGRKRTHWMWFVFAMPGFIGSSQLRLDGPEKRSRSAIAAQVLKHAMARQRGSKKKCSAIVTLHHARDAFPYKEPKLVSQGAMHTCAATTEEARSSSRAEPGSSAAISANAC